MPGMDGTGPSGAGPMTGGGFGRCNPNVAQPAAGGRGLARGRGGRGNRRFVNRNAMPMQQTYSDVTENDLTDRVANLEALLEQTKAENDKLSSENQNLRSKKSED